MKCSETTRQSRLDKNVFVFTGLPRSDIATLIGTRNDSVYMKATPKQYARSLYDVVSRAETDGDIEIVIKNFVRLLAAHKMIFKSRLMVDEFVKIWHEEKGIAEGEIISAKTLDKEAMSKIKTSLMKSLGVKEIIAVNKVDEKMLGGFVAKFGHTVIDASLKNKLQQLKIKLAH